MEICKHSYIRQDPYFFRCVKCGDTDPAEQDEVIEALHNKIDEQQARIQALEKAARGVVEARGIGFMQVHKEDVPEFMHLMNRIDKLAALLEQEGGE